VWAELPKLPDLQVSDTDLANVVARDVDATVVTVHIEKQFAAGTSRAASVPPFGFWCDNTQEILVVVRRPGNAGSNTVADHLAVLAQAIAQVPAAHRKHMLIRADGAGSSQGCSTGSPNRAPNAFARLSTESDSPAIRTYVMPSHSCRTKCGPPPLTSLGTSATVGTSPRSLP
jgi:hypothetical protein